jgi:hypothetical protein
MNGNLCPLGCAYHLVNRFFVVYKKITLLNSYLYIYLSIYLSNLILPNLLYSTPLYSTPLHSTRLYSTLLYSSLLYSSLLYSALLYSTPLYSTLSIYLSISIYLYLSISIYIYLYLSISIYIYLSNLQVSIYISRLNKTKLTVFLLGGTMLFSSTW